MSPAGAPPITDAFAAIAHPVRRSLVTALARGDKPVRELAATCTVSRPAVSQHLKALKAAGLVMDKSEGTRRVYHIDPDGLGELRRWLDQFWGDALESFKQEVEQSQTSRGKKP